MWEIDVILLELKNIWKEKEKKQIRFYEFVNILGKANSSFCALFRNASLKSTKDKEKRENFAFMFK